MRKEENKNEILWALHFTTLSKVGKYQWEQSINYKSNQEADHKNIIL